MSERVIKTSWKENEVTFYVLVVVRFYIVSFPFCFNPYKMWCGRVGQAVLVSRNELFFFSTVFYEPHVSHIMDTWMETFVHSALSLTPFLPVCSSLLIKSMYNVHTWLKSKILHAYEVDRKHIWSSQYKEHPERENLSLAIVKKYVHDAGSGLGRSNGFVSIGWVRVYRGFGWSGTGFAGRARIKKQPSFIDY